MKESKDKVPIKCVLCNQPHHLARCEDFRSKSIEERKGIVASKRLCYNCLGRHTVKECKSEKRCMVCSGQHHTLLHFDNYSLTSGSTSASQGKSTPTISSTHSQSFNQLDQISQSSLGYDPNSQNSDTYSTTVLTSDAKSHAMSNMGILLSSALIKVCNDQGKIVLVQALIAVSYTHLTLPTIYSV